MSFSTLQCCVDFAVLVRVPDARVDGAAIPILRGESGWRGVEDERTLKREPTWPLEGKLVLIC